LRPTASHFAGKTIGGVRFVVTDRDNLNSERLGLELASALNTLYPGKLDFPINKGLIGSMEVIKQLQQKVDQREIMLNTASPVQQFEAVREKYLLY